MIDLEDYIKNGLHEAGCPSWLKVRELDVLMCIVPGPLGMGMTYRQCAEFLGIHRDTVWRCCNRIKERFPEAWERVQSIRRVMSRHQRALKGPRSFDGLTASIGEEGLHDISHGTRRPDRRDKYIDEEDNLITRSADD